MAIAIMSAAGAIAIKAFFIAYSAFRQLVVSSLGKDNLR